MVGGCLHDFLADFDAAGEEDMAELVFEEGFGGFASADNAAEAAGVEVFGEEFYEEVGSGGREFTVGSSVSRGSETS
jgi:hypothetical protein